MKYLLLISCLVLCFCSPEKEAEPKEPVKPDKPIQFEPCPSPSFGYSVNPDPLILECPPEDIAECPKRDMNVILSVKELPFEQGKVRCVTLSSSAFLMLSEAYHGEPSTCRPEGMLVTDSINDPPHFIDENIFKRLVCPWLTATLVSSQVVHISVDKNETGKEREIKILASIMFDYNILRITQSAE